MKITLISGSHRSNSRSGHIAAFAAERLKSMGHEAWVFDLGKASLPLWEEGVWKKSDKPWNDTWADVAKHLRSSDGVVVVSPEWAGMVPPGLKNFFLLCGRSELAHKPGLLIGVSSGRGGAYPIAELRMSSYKNNYLCYLPEHLIVREAENVLNSPTPASENDRLTRERLDYSLRLLELYASSMRNIRTTEFVAQSPWTNGM